MTDQVSVDDVKQVVLTVLNIQDRASDINADTELLGNVPELDSLAVVELAAALEQRFDFVIDDDDFNGEVFESLGSLTDFVRGSLS